MVKHSAESFSVTSKEENRDTCMKIFVSSYRNIPNVHVVISGDFNYLGIN